MLASKFLGFLILLSVAIISCERSPNKDRIRVSPKDPYSKTALREKSQNDSLTSLLETFIDSTNIGIKGKNKLVLQKFKMGDSMYVDLKFYSLGKLGWVINNEMTFENTTYASLVTQIKDYNNDGLNDLSYWSLMAARGANGLKNILLYNPTQNKLKQISNAEYYPNVEYNSERNCLTSLIFHGGVETVFLHLQGDSLIPFACVEQSDSIYVYSIDEEGNYLDVETRENKGFSDFARFTNFDPLEE